MKSIKIGLVQSSVELDNEKNYKHIEQLISESVSKQEYDILCLPERWNYVDIKARDFSVNIQEKRGAHYSFCKQLAKEYNVSLISGAIWEYETRSQEQPVVSAYYFDRSGNEMFCQHKIHLYLFEKTMFVPGSELIVYHDPQFDLKFSILICFDVAFYQTPRLAVVNGAELIFTPTLIRDTGLDNWDIYLKARALENRVPIAACNSVFELPDRKFLGKSKIISFFPGSESPINLNIQEAGQSAEVLNGQIDLDFPNKIRKKRIEEAVDQIRVIKK